MNTRNIGDLAEPSAHELELLVGKRWSTIFPWSTSQLRDCLAVSAVSLPPGSFPIPLDRRHLIWWPRGASLGWCLITTWLSRIGGQSHYADSQVLGCVCLATYARRVFTASLVPLYLSTPEAASRGLSREVTILWLVLTAPIVTITLIFFPSIKTPCWFS